MRTSKALLTLLALSLVAVGGIAAFAVAQDNESNQTHPGPGAHPGNDTDNETAPAHNETDEQQRHDELEGARHAAIQSFQENRTAAIKAYLEALNATRASFLENKTKVIDDCRAQHNSTTDNKTDMGQCVKDGLKPLIEKAHADIKAAQEKLRDALLSFREAAMLKFGHDRDGVNARHHHSG